MLHGFPQFWWAWRHQLTSLPGAGFRAVASDMRGYGDSDKPEGTDGYDARSLAEEFRALVDTLGFGHGRPLVLVAFDMGAPPALLWAADHPGEISALLYLEEPVLLQEVITKIIRFDRQAMERGSLWWWILPPIVCGKSFGSHGPRPCH